MIELKFDKYYLQILLLNIAKNHTSTFKYKKVSLHRGSIKGRTAAKEMLLIVT